MHKTLANWLSYLESLHPKTIALGLERVDQVWQRLNLSPNFPIITVGGTNGKGSVCAMLESTLHAAGYKVGCYTSPHLLAYNERVRIAKKPASDPVLCASFEKIEEARKGQRLDGRSSKLAENSSFSRFRGNDDPLEIPLTYFEFGTLAAMLLFIEKQVEVAILEVGLGGRLDAVNIFDSDCAAVTSVDMDHMDYLGDTREKIAFEKAGVFRAGKVAVFGDRDMPAAIASEVQRIGARLWRLGGEFDHELPQGAGGLERGQWNYRGPGGARTALPYPALRGAYQLNNASTVLAVLDALKDKLPVSMDAVRRGLTEVSLSGRFQVLPGKPTMILDVAHNPHAARALAGNLAAMPPGGRTFAVFSMLRDKDIAGVVRTLDGQVDAWMVAGINAPRGLAATQLAQLLNAEKVKGIVRTFDTVADALAQACNEAAENDRIAVFGSFHTVAEAMHARGLRQV
ncbi:MAG: bifunctional folylpolyglutamate synthase/dihydrofolate synthase [Gallionellaceae bacterium]|nr:bifunctional folylpolyglutamate synthase/dihydrofolate synthase [Gallionellaceae bacterium]